MLLGDGIDPLVGLYEQWPWMVIVAAAARWVANRLDKLVDRHISYMDSSEKREDDRVGTDKQLAVALASISDELKDHSGKLSQIKDLKAKVDCPVRDSWFDGMPPGASPKLHPGLGGT